MDAGLSLDGGDPYLILLILGLLLRLISLGLVTTIGFFWFIPELLPLS
jgi:hypothetical protein